MLRRLRLRRVLSIFAAILATGAAHATETVWHCFLIEGQELVACRLLAAGPPMTATDPAPARLPPMARLIRSDPQAVADEVIVIPLFGTPFDAAGPARLARSVMCGRRETCRVEWTPAPGPVPARASTPLLPLAAEAR